MKNNYIKMVGNCISFIENNLKGKVTVEDVLNETYYSYPHFYRIFMDIVGESVTGYIRKRKLSCAAHDLIVEKKSIVDVALDYGFSSQQTFNRAFTNMFKYLRRNIVKKVCWMTSTSRLYLKYQAICRLYQFLFQLKSYRQ